MQQILNILKEKKLRITDQRIAVLDFLIKKSTAQSVQQIYKEMSKKEVKIDEASVYRTIELLKKYDLVHINSEGGVRLCNHHSCSHRFHYSIECPHCKSISEPHLSAQKEKELAKFFSLKPELIQHIYITSKCRQCD